jgi:hypothetical protein
MGRTQTHALGEAMPVCFVSRKKSLKKKRGSTRLPLAVDVRAEAAGQLQAPAAPTFLLRAHAARLLLVP